MSISKGVGTKKIRKKPKKAAVSAAKFTSEVEADIIDESLNISDLPMKTPLPAVLEETKINGKKEISFDSPLGSKFKIIKPAWAVVIVFIAVGAVAVGFYLKQSVYSAKIQADATTEANKDPAEIARQETLEAVKKASAIIQLPEGEEPNVATVVDLAALKGENFFASAQLGDKALVYLKAGKAFLYRPSENKIIEVGSFDPASIGSAVLGKQTQSKKNGN